MRETHARKASKRRSFDSLEEDAILSHPRQIGVCFQWGTNEKCSVRVD